MSQWRPLTTNLLLGGGALILVALVASYILNNFQPTTEVRLSSGIFHVQLATTKAEREKGLSGVEQLDQNGGLLMVFDTLDEGSIWMKDMKIPIDVVWLDQDKEVIYTAANLSPDLGISKIFRPKEPAMYILEVPAGTIKNSAIKKGDTATFIIEERQ